MGLKQSIVVVNEFTRPDPSGKGGSRGGTPGAYVTRYMAREMAVEPIAPITRTDLDTFVTKYMARPAAVEELLESYRSGEAVADGARASAGYTAPTLAGRRKQRSLRRAAARAADKVKSWVSRGRARLTVSEDVPVEELGRRELKDAFAKATGDGGVSFGHNGVSLSHERLHADADNIQKLFESGHTVLKTVLSFEHDYLVEKGCVPEGMVLGPDGAVRRGAYRGNLDQLKLRLAVMEGLAHMARVGNFDDLRYVGVIQVDTAHVHCHLAMVDAGPGRLAVDGTQKGKLTMREMALLRKGMAASLDRHKTVKYLSSAVGYQRRSVSAYVKSWAYQSLGVSGQAQLVLATLPPDRKIWTAKSNRREMAKPNRLVRALVLEQLARPGSPLPAAMEEIKAYAAQRRAQEGLSEAEHDRLVSDGRERVIVQAMNGVYAVLAAVGDDELSVSTAMLTSMSVDYEELMEQVEQGSAGAQDVSAGRFAMRLRSFSERCERHRALREDYLVRARGWEEADEQGRAAPGSEAMHRHYMVEADYHGRLLSKYQHYLDLATASMNGWDEQWREVETYGRKLTGLRALRADKSIPKMKNTAAAEQLGREIYGQRGGGLLALTGGEGRAGRARIDAQLERMTASYERKVEDLIESWRAKGPAVRLRVAEPGEAPGPDERLVSAGDAVMREQSGEGSVTLGTPGIALMATAAPQHAFEQVKGLDMHELSLDWAADQTVGRRTASRFVEMSEVRRDAALAAQSWMVETGQSAAVDEEMGTALSDIEAMADTAGAVAATGVLHSSLAEAAAKVRARREAERQELLEMEAREHGEAALDELLSAAVERDELEAVIMAQAAAHRASKPRGRTMRLDTGVGGAINASVYEVVRAFDAQRVLEDDERNR